MRICVLLTVLGTVSATGADRPDRAMCSNFLSAHYPEELRRPNVRALTESRDEPMIWVDSDSGLISWDGNRITKRLEEPVPVLKFDHLQWLWLGTEKSGLYRLYNNQQAPTHYSPGTTDDSLVDGHVRCIAEGVVSIGDGKSSKRQTLGSGSPPITDCTHPQKPI